jgi:hypothetical protein
MAFSLPSDTRSGLNIWLLAQSSLVGLAAIVGLLWVVFTSLAPPFVSSFNLFAIQSFEGRGLMVGSDAGVAPRRLDLIEAGLTLPDAETLKPTARNRRARIYPEVEHIVACCRQYGRFQLNESLLAEYYGVSRTVAHEVLTQLDRVGLVTQDRNRRWYAGPLTPEQMRQHFELRWLLEPVALDQAFPYLDRADLCAKRERIRRVLSGKPTPAKLERVERDLHIDTVLTRPNSLLNDAIKRSQLPLLATHTPSSAISTPKRSSECSASTARSSSA